MLNRGSFLRALAALACLHGVVGHAQERERLETFVPRLSDAEAQLDHARRVKRTMYERREDARPFWRKLAVEAYQAVRAFHPDERERCVEGAFRAGELLRAGGDDDGALEEFAWAAQQAAGDFSTRARLEIGHLHRRNERSRLALDAYLDVAGNPRATASRRDDAWLWAGQVWRAKGRIEDARRAWRRVAERAHDPLDRIRAFDLLGALWLAENDLEAACGVLNECLRDLAEAALEETSRGEEVRNALLRMRIVDELPRAIARRNSSSQNTGTSRKS